jgi:type IV pilus assembly protein PilB
MSLTAKKSLIQILGERGKITRDQAVEAMQRKQATTESLERILIDMGVSEADVYEGQAESLGVLFLDLKSIKVDPQARNLLPEDMQERYGAVPIRLDGKSLTVAMLNPKDVFAVDEMRMKTQLNIRPVLVPPTQLENLRNSPASNGSNGSNGTALSINGVSPEAQESADFDEHMSEILGMLAPVETDPSKKAKKDNKSDLLKAMEAESGEAEENDIGAPGGVVDGQLGADEAPIIRIVNTILMYAVKDGASDIHIEPQRKGVRIRYRIDGVLHEQMKVPQYVLNPLVSRIKIMADMNIAERRIPQDGRIHIKMQEKDFDLRVSSLPTAFGEKVVMRILDKSSVLIGLDKLGLYPETQAQLLDMCHQPNGMFMICGPTGSGKTTTLYSVLNVINSIEKNLLTVEDPIEYQLPGLSQVHVNRKAGLSFANALRAFLRQDPDIIMVGEIRDLETAEIAVQAALTGHLVLSTVHTNDAPSTATRLADMGVEPFLISASLVGSLAQRLARRICSNCKEEHVPPREILLRFGHDPDLHPDVKFWKGRGCDRCRQTGYKGRMGIYELMRVNEEIADMIVRRAPLSELKEAARSYGMQTLQEDGFRRCKDGMTTVDEVMRVVFTGGH